MFRILKLSITVSTFAVLLFFLVSCNFLISERSSNHYDRSRGKRLLLGLSHDKRKQPAAGNSNIQKYFKELKSRDKNFRAEDNEDSTQAPKLLPEPPKPLPKPPVPKPVKDERIILPSSGVAYERFGHVVSTSNGILAVATHYTQLDEASIQENYIYIFCQAASANVASVSASNEGDTGSGSSATAAWTEVTKIPTGYSYDNIIAMDSTFLFVSESGASSEEAASGKVYVFSYSMSQTATEDPTVVTSTSSETQSKCQRVADRYSFENAQVLSSPSQSATDENFGSSLAVKGELAAVASSGGSSSSSSDGAVYMYHYQSEVASWTYVATLDSKSLDKTNSEGHGDHDVGTVTVTASGSSSDFGAAIALTDTIVAVSSTEVVYIYNILQEEGGYSFVFASSLDASASNDADISEFGHTMAFAEETGFVSALTSDGRGTVFVFQAIANQESGAPSSWKQVDQLVNPYDTSFALFGESISLTSYNGDSFAVISSPGDEISGHLSGSLFLYGKSSIAAAASGKSDVSEWVALGRVTNENTAAYDHYGQSVALDGNLVVVGADLADGVTSRSGAVYVEDELLEYMSDLLNQNQGGQPSPQQPSPEYSDQKRANSWKTITSHKPFVIALVVAAALPAIVIAAILGKRMVGSMNRMAATGAEHKSSFSLVLDESTRGDMDRDEVWNDLGKSDHSDEDGYTATGNHRGSGTKTPQHQRLSHLEIDI